MKYVSPEKEENAIPNKPKSAKKGSGDPNAKHKMTAEEREMNRRKP
jgi:hypothetical protein